MKKIAFCAAAGNGISPLEQIMIKKGYEVYGSDSSFDEGLNQDRKAALESVGLKIVPQDGSAVFPDTECLYISSIINEETRTLRLLANTTSPSKKDPICLKKYSAATLRASLSAAPPAKPRPPR